MYSLLILLLPFVSLSLTDKCDSSAYKLATFALSNGNNNALERLKCSTEHYDIDFKIIVLGKSSFNHHGDEKAHRIFKLLDGTTSLLDLMLLLRQMKAILFVSFSTPAAIVVHSLHQTRILNVFDFIGSHDGKTLSYNILYSDNSVDTLGLTFDVKGILFQNVDSASSEVMLSFDDMHNFARDVRPPVILGSRKGSQLLNHLGNYMAKPGLPKTAVYNAAQAAC
uniref:PLOD1-3-like GT domain-containing protein n=1 Tax=Wuchereria bancrofti TaxID=6293 RepID=A0AAF5RXD9_WUCBA